MPKLEIKIPHNLTQSEALSRIQKFLPELKAQHSDLTGYLANRFHMLVKKTLNSKTMGVNG